MTTETTDAFPNHLELPGIAAAVPRGSNPAPAKPTKAASKRYFLAVTADQFGFDFDIAGIPEGGFRNKDELAKFAKSLPLGEYTVLVAFTKKIVVSDVRRVKGV